MLTTLNLTLLGSDANDGAVLPFDGISTPGAGDDRGFRSMLRLSLDAAPIDGKLLPVAGERLPLQDTALPPGLEEPQLLPIPPIEVSDVNVEWPPGLTPAGIAESDVRVAVETSAGETVAEAIPTLKAAIEERPVPARLDRVSTAEVGTSGREPLPAGSPVSGERPTVPGVADRMPLPQVPVPAASPETSVPDDTLPASPVRTTAEYQAVVDRALPVAGSAAEAVPRSIGLTEAVDRLRKEAATPRTSAVASADTAAPSGPAAANTAPSRPAGPTLPAIPVPVGDTAWSESLSERVLMLTGNKLGNAEIRLTPAELGPVRVQVSVDESTATVAFQATNATTRDAIEQALPRLREMLAENGLSLGQASVSDQGVAREGADDGAGDGASGLSDADDADAYVEETGAVVAAQSAHEGLIDTFA